MNSNPILKTGIWRATLVMKGQELPFNFEVKSPPQPSPKGREKEFFFIEIINADERIKANEIKIADDSIEIQLPIFDTKIKGKIIGNKIEGTWTDYSRKTGYVLPFIAEFGKSFRFTEKNEKPISDISGKWEVDFLGDTSKAIGEFVQKENHLKGTFLTPTGDYRYLEGTVQNDSVFLSCFDGSHAFLFKAKINSDATLSGEWWSGIHHYEKWTAKRNEKFSLPNPNTLTFLNEGFEKLTFTFPNTDSQLVSLDDEQYKDKVIIVQILGTWCPNCMDESAFLADFYKKNQSKGVEIIGLAFERTTEFDKVKKNIERLKKRFDIQHEILFAGTNKTEEATKTLPMLNHIMCYPTTIFIDKKEKVRKIHTGYSGPATGKHYDEFVREFEKFVAELVNE